jgi:hypothetical protein
MIRNLSRWLAAAVAVGALAAPAASAMGVDSPYAGDPARTLQRSASPAESTQRVDVRSPDARDAADPREIVSSPPVQTVKTVEAGGFDWADAAIGAGVLALVLMGVGGMLALRRGPRPGLSTVSR